MKKLMITCALIAFGIGAFAQNDTNRIPTPNNGQDKTNQEKEYQNNPDYNKNNQDQNWDENKDMNKTNQDKNKTNNNKSKTTGQSMRDSTQKDCTVRMVNGKIMKVNPDGTTTALTKEMTLQNGVIIMADGTVKMKDGKTVQLKEGECLTQSGQVKSKKNKTGNPVDGTK